MATELRERLERLQRKSAVLVDKYQALLTQSQQTAHELEDATATIARLKSQVEQLEQDNQYLRMAQQQLMLDKRYSSLQLYFDVDPL